MKKAALVLVLLGALFIVLRYTVFSDDKWETTVGIVKDTSISKHRGSDGTEYQANISYEYTADGITHFTWGILSIEDTEEDAERSLQRYKIGDSIDIVYKKNKAETSKTKEWNSQPSVSMTFGIIFLSLGGILFFLIFKGEKSEEGSV